MSPQPGHADLVTPGLPDLWSRKPDADPAASDVADLFVEVCRTFGDRPAYKIGNAWSSYSDCAERVSGIAASLDETLQRHVAATGKQPVIAVLLPNSHIVLECFFVAAITRSIVFPLNDRFSVAELERGIRASGATILLTSDAYAKTLLAMDWSSIGIDTIVWTGTAVDVTVPNHLVWAPAQAPAPGTRNPPWSRDLPAYLHGFNTSGTTGQIKTILHSTANVVAHTLASIDALGLSSDDEHCWAHIGPMFHVGDAVFVWIATLLGARHVFHDNQLQVTGVASLLAGERVTIVKLVPSMLQILCGSDALKGLRFPCLKWILTGGAGPDAALIHRTGELFGCDFIQGYGMTEATCHVAFKNETRSPSIEGLSVLPGLDLKIVDENDASLDAGDVGEVAIKGPTVFERYVNDGGFETPVAGFTADGFYRSGDLGFLDAAGKLHIVGRRKDMINVGGENVFGWEVERIVAALPAVRECAAFAMPHELLGEVVELAVVRTSEELTSDIIKESCRRQLASFKVPQRVYFVDKLPRTPTGKVQKHLIREQVGSELPAAAEVSPPARHGAADSVRQIVSDYMKTLTDATIGPDDPLFDAGLDSLGALDLIARLEKRFGTKVSQTLLYDHPTTNDLVAYFEASNQAESQHLPMQAAADENPTMASTPTAARRSATAPVSLLLQSVGIFLRPLVLALSVLPVLMLFDLYAQRLSKFELLLTGPGWLALLLADTMAIVVLVSRALAPSGIEQCELWSVRYFRWLFVHNIFRSLEIPLGVLRGSPVLNVFYRLCGAKIGRGVQLHSVTLHDLDRLEIGDHTIVSRDVNLQPAVISGGVLVRRPIQIGSGCFIGPNATILGGARIPDGVTVPTLATISPSTTSFDRSGPPKTPRESRPGWQSRLCHLAGYLLVGYAVSAVIAIGMLFVQQATKAVGGTVYSISALIIPSPDQMVSGGHELPSLGFFAAIALAIYLVMPVCYFALVVACKRTFIRTLSPQAARGDRAMHAGWSHWLFNKLIDVPFFRMHLRLNVMSHVVSWNYRLLGMRIGTRPFMAAPYTAEPELVELADGAMLAGNVSAYGIDAGSGSLQKIRLGRSAIVANSCVLQAGADLAPSTLLGDLSSAGGGDASPPNTISVGSPPRVVGRTSFDADSISRSRYVLSQAMLAPLQWICLSISNVAGFVAMGLCFNALAGFAPFWAVWTALLVLPAVPRLVKTAFVPLFKWMVLGKITAGEFPAYGWTYCRWVLLETIIMDAEPAFLTQLHGTLWLNLLWRSLGARVGSNACILSSSLGCEFDLKQIGEDTVLQFQSLVFGHSIEHHALLFKPARIENRAEVGAGAIVEAGAVVDEAAIVPPSRPVHARQIRPPVENRNLSRPSVAPPATLSQSPPLQAEQDNAAILIDHTGLAAMARAIFVASGSSEEEARLVADHLVEANLRGHDSHGVGMIPMYLRNLAKGTLRANCVGRIASDQGAMIVYDGERGYGQVVARAATEIGIEQARRAGFAIVALRNAHHIGRIGTYGEMCADAGLISIHFVNVTDQKPSVAPWLGGDARFGTNPFCIAVPAAEAGRPVILDMATSVIALGKVRVARNKGQQLDPGILLGADGQPTTDPGVMFRQPRGALTTFGEHKGYALAFICEILGGALTGGGTARPEHQVAATTTNGMLSIVIDPSRLVERDWLAGEIRAMTDYVTASPPIRPGEKVLIPGDPERQTRARRIAAGIPIDHETWHEIVEAADSLRVPIATARADLP